MSKPHPNSADLEHTLNETRALVDAAVRLSEWEESTPEQANAVTLLHIAQTKFDELEELAAARRPDLKVVS